MWVSGLYRLAPPTVDYTSREESDRRVALRLRRLASMYGKGEVIRRIRAYPVPESLALTRAWLVVAAESVPERNAAGTI